MATKRSISEKLSVGTKIGYGAGEFSSSVFFTISSFLLLNFLTDTVGLLPALAGTALMIGKIWDAITDPAVGFLSDKTRTRWGRRRPWFLLAAIPFGIAFFFMFKNPGLEEQRSLFLWAMLMYIILSTFYTCTNVPYNSLLPELTPDYDERTSVTGFKTVFAVMGTLIGAGASLPLIAIMGEDTSAGFMLMGAIFGLLIAISAATPFFATQEPPFVEPVEKKNFFVQYKEAFSNTPYLLILIPWFLNTMAVSVLMATLIYYFKYVFLNEQLLTVGMIILLVGSVAFVPLAIKASEKIGKRTAYIIGMTVTMLSVLAFAFFAHILGPISAYVIMLFAGIGFSTHYVLPWAIVPDAIEHDYAESGMRREGIYYGLWSFSIKVASAMAAFIAGWVLSVTGFDAALGDIQPETALFGIRMLVGPATALLILLANIVHWFYPIDRTRYDEIRAKIEARES